MPKFRKKPVVIDAEQWFKDGNNSSVEPYCFTDQVNRRICEHCSETMDEHGSIRTLEGQHTVCPGDWIITGIQGEKYPCKDQIFRATYTATSSCADCGAMKSADQFYADKNSLLIKAAIYLKPDIFEKTYDPVVE